MLYATFAALWIVVSSYFLTITVADPVLMIRIELIKGLVFVAVTSVLLYLLLKVRGDMGIQDAGGQPPGARRLLLIFVALALMVPLIRFSITELYGPQVERAAYANLEAIARLKTEQIENWLGDRHGDSEVLAGDDAFAARVSQFVQHEQDAKLSRLILDRFEHLLTNYHYSKILLLNAHGRLLLSTGGDVTPGPALPSLLRQALASKQVQRRDMYLDKAGDIHLEWVVPLVVSDAQGKHMVAVVVLRVTAQQFIFPLIQTWPTASASGETLLVRGEGESAMFLNDLRHRQDSALRLALPLDDADLPAAVAIRSTKPGTLQGKDYRNVAVLAAHRPVVGTNWHVVAKIDLDEVLAPLRDLVLWVSLIALAALVAVSAALLLLWRQQQRAYQVEMRARSMAAIEESERRYRALAQSSNDAIIVADSTGNIVKWNPSAVQLFGYTEAEILGQSLARLMPERFRERHREGVARVVAGGEHRIIGKTFEFAGLRKNGSEFPLEISLAQWQTAAGQFFSATLRDITERKQLEQQLSRRLHHLDVMERIARICLDSKSIEELLGRVLDEMLAVFNADRAWFLHPCDPDAPSWSVPLERTRPEWPGAFARGMVMPMTPEVAEVFREVLASTEPFSYGPVASRSIPAAVAEQFSIRSQIQMAVRPRVGDPWIIGLHHCAQAHAYDDEDELLIFKDIGLRVAEALSSMIMLKNLRESEEKLQRAQAVGQIGSWLFNISANRLEWSAETYRMLGVSQQQAVDFETFAAAIHPDDRDFVLRAWSEAMTDVSFDIEHRIVAEGQTRWVRERAQVERDPEGRPLTCIGTMQDITERKAAEAKIQRLAQLYAALSQCNEAILRCTDEDELFPQVCRSAVQFGGMKMAWIGLVDEMYTQVKPVASYGDGLEVLAERQDSLNDDSTLGYNVTRTAIREKQPCWSQDFQHDPLTTQWHELGAHLGWGAAASLPLLRNGAVVGTFTLYASETNAFDEAARKLLVEIVADVSFALDGFDREARRKRSELDLAESERHFRSLFENMLEGYVYCKMLFSEGVAEEFIFLDVNHAFETLTGLKDVVLKRASEVIPGIRESNPELLEIYGRVALTGQPEQFEMYVAGLERWLSIAVYCPEKEHFVAIFDNITERKQSEQVLAESEQRFRSLVEQSLAGIYIIQDGRFIYVNPRFAEIFGYAAASELIGVEPTSLVVEQDRGTVAENIRSRIESEVQNVSYAFTAVRKDGSLIDVGVHGAQATYSGRPAIIGLMQDVSEKKRDEERIQRYVMQLEDAFMHTVEVATTLVELRDPYTAGHEKRVAQIAVAIGTELGLDEHRIEGLRIGGYIHDIGKIIIPAEILSKPGRLSAAEYELIKGHPQAGYDILKNVDFPWPVADIAYQHHERLDGRGYPRGLKGEEILLEARITAVADVVEAMSSHRPYRPGLGLEQALAEIERGSGSIYCSAVAGACLRLFREKGYTLPSTEST